MKPHYAELHCKTNFSFLEGASHPDELAARRPSSVMARARRHGPAQPGRRGPRHVAAKEAGLKLLVGADTAGDAPPVVLLAADRASYGRLSRLLTCGRRRAPKGECHLTLSDVAEHAEGLLADVLVGGKQNVERGARNAESKRQRAAQLARG